MTGSPLANSIDETDAASDQRTRLLAHLRAVGLFADIATNDTALDKLAAMMIERTYASKQDIIREGSQSTEMFILIRGRASVFKSTPTGDEHKVAIYDGTKSVSFGESGLIESDSRTATIRAETDCICLVLDRDSFDVFSRQHPEWALPVFRRIAHSVMARLRKTNEDMLLLYNALVSEIRGQ